MLGKLIKHDWKAVWRIMFLMNAILVIMTVIGILSFQTSFWNLDIPKMDVLSGIALLIYYVSIIVVGMSSVIYFSVHFYRNLYTDEGYLMHTLPVRPKDLILSKLTVSSIWCIITSITIITSIFSLLYTVIVNFEKDYTVEEFTEGLHTVVNFIAINLDTPFAVFVFTLIMYVVISTVCSMLMIYGSISIGQLWSKHKILGSILTYLGIYIVHQIVSSITLSFATSDFSTLDFESSIDANSNLANGIVDLNISSTIWSAMFSTTIVMLILGVVLFFVSDLIMKKKLNLD